MKYENKLHLIPEENRQLAKTYLTKLVFTTAEMTDLKGWTYQNRFFLALHQLQC